MAIPTIAPTRDFLEFSTDAEVESRCWNEFLLIPRKRNAAKKADLIFIFNSPVKVPFFGKFHRL